MLTFVSVTDAQVREIIKHIADVPPGIITRDTERDIIEVQITTVWESGDGDLKIDDQFTLSKLGIESETGFPLTSEDQSDYQEWLAAVRRNKHGRFNLREYHELLAVLQLAKAANAAPACNIENAIRVAKELLGWDEVRALEKALKGTGRNS